jgi:hypothetical protein
VTTCRLSELDEVLLDGDAAVLFRGLPLEADRGGLEAGDLKTGGGTCWQCCKTFYGRNYGAIRVTQSKS